MSCWKAKSKADGLTQKYYCFSTQIKDGSFIYLWLIDPPESIWYSRHHHSLVLPQGIHVEATFDLDPMTGTTEDRHVQDCCVTSSLMATSWVCRGHGICLQFRLREALSFELICKSLQNYNYDMYWLLKIMQKAKDNIGIIFYVGAHQRSPYTNTDCCRWGLYWPSLLSQCSNQEKKQ